MPQITLKRPLIINGTLRRPDEGAIEVSEADAARAQRANAVEDGKAEAPKEAPKAEAPKTPVATPAPAPKPGN